MAAKAATRRRMMSFGPRIDPGSPPSTRPAKAQGLHRASQLPRPFGPIVSPAAATQAAATSIIARPRAACSPVPVPHPISIRPQPIMRLSGSFVAPSLLGLAAAAAPSPRIYIQDLDAPAHLSTQTAPTLSADTARLIFAQRLGLSQFHSLKHADDDTIQYLNDFGGSRHQLFSDDEPADETKHIMVVVQGVKNTEGWIHLLDNGLQLLTRLRLSPRLGFLLSRRKSRRR